MPADSASTTLWAEVSEFVTNAMGLHFPLERRDDLKRGMAAAATEFGFSNAIECAKWLLTSHLKKSVGSIRHWHALGLFRSPPD